MATATDNHDIEGKRHVAHVSRPNRPPLISTAAARSGARHSSSNELKFSRRVMDRLTGGSGPLFGRADPNLRLEPFAFEQVGAFVSKLSATDRLTTYAATGGYPLHLLAWDDRASLAENLRALARPGALLFDAAPQIVFEEFPAGVGFERVLRAIGRGRHSFGEIKTEADLRIETPLATLQHMGLVRGELPLGGPRHARPHYVLTDPYLRFWFGPLSRIRQSVEMGGDPATVLSAGSWLAHLGSVFEDEARRHGVRRVNAGDLPTSSIGRWWRTGRNPIELDVVGRAEDAVVFVGEAKWSDSSPGARDIAYLRDRADDSFGPSPDRLLVFWSRRPKRIRREGEVVSYSVDDMAAP